LFSPLSSIEFKLEILLEGIYELDLLEFIFWIQLLFLMQKLILKFVVLKSF